MARVGLCAFVCSGCHIGNKAVVSPEEKGATEKRNTGRSYITKRIAKAILFVMLSAHEVFKILFGEGIKENIIFDGISFGSQ